MQDNELREKLLNQGIPEFMLDSIIKAANKAAAPKAEKKQPGRWFPGMAESKTSKVEADVEVTSKCQTCGAVEVKTIKMVIKADSPRTQTIATSLCNHCPDFFRGLEMETLVTLLLLKEHPAIGKRGTGNLTQVKMAQHMTPESVVTFKSE